jgi:hypothetical protein
VPERKIIDDGHLIEFAFADGQKIVVKSEDYSLLVRRNRRSFLGLIEQANTLWKTVKDGNATMEMVGVRSTNGIQRSFYYRYKFNKHDYFVKRIPAKHSDNFGGGVDEVAVMADAGRVLKSIPGVKVIDYHLGYQDKYNTYVISRWDDSLREQLDVYLKRISGLVQTSKIKAINDRVRIIQDKLKGSFMDVLTYNMAYDEKNDLILIFDLQKRPGNV